MVFAAASLACLAVKEAVKRGATDGAAAEPADGVVVYYFHGDARCPTCNKIEAYTKESVEGGFADALRQGRILCRIVNTDSGGDNRYIEHYSLITKSVVVSLRRGGKEVRWKNLEKIWDLVGDKPAFVAYIQGEVKPFLEEG